MIKKSSAFLMIGAVVLMISCEKGSQSTSQIDWSQYPDPSKEQDDGLMKPAPCAYNVVAHRGGSSECGAPDNSIASLKYAMQLGCYASECDIYWTKDDNVVVAHADGSCRINGLYPWQSTLAQIRAAGKLSNGEEVPSLEDFIKTVKVSGNCTRLWMDIKLVSYPSTNTEVTINAAKRACEIVTEMGAKHFMEFICTGNGTVMATASAYARSAGIPIGWMGTSTAASRAQKGYTWANLCVTNMSSASGGSGSRTLEEFQKEGVELSVYNVDKKAGDSNAVYSSAAVDYYVTNYPSFKALCTNYPSWLITKLDNAYKK